MCAGSISTVGLTNQATVELPMPSDLNKQIFGPFTVKTKYARRLLKDLSSFKYLFLSGSHAEFKNFLYSKTMVPTGEGSQKWLYYLTDYRKIKKDPFNAPLPKYIEMETTTLCNKRCHICEYIYWPKDEQVKRHLTLDEFKHVVNQIPDLRWANLTGEGSSFLNKDYPLMLKYLSDKTKASIWLVDHLSDITQEQLIQDVFPFVKGIYVSCDAATKTTYESIKAGCNFDNVVANLRAIIDYKRRHKTPFPHLTFRYVILNNNMHEMPQFLDLLNSIAEAHEWGGSSSYVEFTGLLFFPEIEHYFVDEVPQAIIKELLKRKGGIDFQFVHAEQKRNPPLERCDAWMEPYIMLPGYVLPCCSVMMSNRRPFLRHYSFGNVFEKDFKELWRGDYYSRFRKTVLDPCGAVPSLCVGCRAFQTQHRIDKYGIWDIHK